MAGWRLAPEERGTAAGGGCCGRGPPKDRGCCSSWGYWQGQRGLPASSLLLYLRIANKPLACCLLLCTNTVGTSCSGFVFWELPSSVYHCIRAPTFLSQCCTFGLPLHNPNGKSANLFPGTSWYFCHSPVTGSGFPPNSRWRQYNINGKDFLCISVTHLSLASSQQHHKSLPTALLV